MVPAPRPPARFLAFTLVEMMVSMAIFCLMMAALAQFVALVSKAWQQGQQRIDNFTRARAILDVMARDIQVGVFRPDLPAFSSSSVSSTNSDGTMYLQNVGASTNAFYTRRPGIGNNVRDVSLVVYSLNLTSTNATLQRADYAIPWTAPTSGWAAYFPFQGSLNSLLPYTTPRDTAEGVIDLEMVFRLANGTTVKSYPGYFPTNAVTAVGVAVAVLDAQTMKLLTGSQLSQLNSTLTAAVTGTNSIKADWDKALNSPQFQYAAYPQPTRSGLKTFERYVTCEPGF